MTDTTIAISKEFHEWLKSKGNKGENYEDIIKRVIKAEYIRDLDKTQKSPDVSSTIKPLEQKIAQQKIKKSALKLNKPLETKAKPKKKSPEKLQKSTMSGKKIKTKLREPKHAVAQKPYKKGLEEWRNSKNLELQHLNVEFELAKLSNNADRIKELSTLIAKLNESLKQNKSK